MIFTGTKLKVGDNSGAIRVQCIKIMSRTKYRWGKLSDVVLISVRKIRPHKKVKKKDKHRFLIVNTKVGVKRLSQVIKFVVNGGLVLKKEDPVPLSSRVHLISSFELRRGFRRIVVMSSINV